MFWTRSLSGYTRNDTKELSYEVEVNNNLLLSWTDELMIARRVKIISMPVDFR
jgi:hypothetical protein